jgi:hypothetical protein
MRGLVGEIEDDGEAQLGIEPEEVPLVEGQACPDCRLPLAARWLSREELYGRCANHAKTSLGASMEGSIYFSVSSYHLLE